MDGHKAKTGKAQLKKVGHTSGKNFGQNPSAQERGTKSGTGSDLSYK